MSDKTLKDCCSFQEGYVNPSQTDREYFDGPIKWLRASDLNDGLVFNTEKTLSQKGFNSAGKSAFLFKKDTISISKSGTIGRLGILKDEMCGNRAVINIDVNKSQADLHYIFYLLKYKKNEIVRKAEGSIQKNLYVSALETISLNHTDTDTQNQIAKVLCSLDSKIALNNRINAELEAMAKTVYDYWFVQFDFPAPSPSGRAGEGSPYKSSGGRMVWCEELKREVPEGWEVETIASIADCNKWTINNKTNFEFINYLDTSNLTNNQIDSFININCKTDKIPSRAMRVISLNDILISTVRPNQCHYGIIKEPVPNMIASSGFAQIRSKKESISNDLLYFYLTDKRTIDRLQQIAETSVSAYPSISPTDIMNLNFCFPKDAKILTEANKLFDSINSKISKNQHENQQLSSLRDWLLPMLMNGQVSVGDMQT